MTAAERKLLLAVAEAVQFGFHGGCFESRKKVLTKLNKAIEAANPGASSKRDAYNPTPEQPFYGPK